ncbi:hypothetical protein LWI28_020328 [Acer negundo]|uniref:Uncharacterized protein n=1 Tax=Acer negundo TaxID=4023 RepID=A0AAD5NM30_ACENE|nr:hypothetical protein LWI28_020328 [Acer negundo]
MDSLEEEANEMVFYQDIVDKLISEDGNLEDDRTSGRLVHYGDWTKGSGREKRREEADVGQCRMVDLVD